MDNHKTDGHKTDGHKTDGHKTDGHKINNKTGYKIDELKNSKQDSSTSNYKIISKKDYIIKPNGFIINNDDIHGIKHNYASLNGIEFNKVAELIKPDFMNAELIVAHNISFDKNVLLSELFRIECNDLINHINKIKYYCTSRGCLNVTRIKFRNTYKQPKLSELYYYLFNKNIEGQHDAIFDTENLMLCFIELVNKKYITKDIIDKFV